MRCFATCAFGVESVVRDELKGLGMQNVRAEDARVFFDANEEGIVQANLWLRCADRVFIELSSLEAETFDALFEGVKAMDWKEILPRDAAVTVTGKSALSKLVSVRDIQAIAKKAICTKMMQSYGYVRCPETGEAYNIEIGMLRNRATVALNTSGAGLNRRGYRDLSSKAPLRETLASAMILLARYDGSEILLDPCCGSGTIAIEAAMIASHTAPGLKRGFAFDGWQNYQKTAVRQREEAKCAARREGFAHIHASDIDPKMVRMSRRHAKLAGMQGLINFEIQDVNTLQLPAKSGVVVTNPPYGERLERAEDVVRALGTLKAEHPQWGLFALSSDPSFEREAGIKATKRRKLYNGNMKCEYHMYYRQRESRREEQ